MKTNRKVSLVAAKTKFSLPATRGENMLCRSLAALILLVPALQLQLFVPAAHAEPTGGKNGNAQRWSVQVDKVNPGDVSLEPSFGVAIYENLLEELAKTKQFKQVYRSGDRNASDVAALLILKTTVQKYTPGSETRRAVTTVAGATKLNVRIRLFTCDGHLVLENVVEGDVRFIGGNLRATHNLARNVARSLRRATLPDPAIPVTEQKIGNASKLEVGTITAAQERLPIIGY